MARKTKNTKDRKIKFLEEQMENNTLAIKEGPKKKSWSIHDLKSLKPITTPQRMMFESFYMGNNLVAHGSAGTGKSMVALYLALNAILDKDTPQEKIIIVRSSVASRNVGFLPGDKNEKMEPFETPYRDIVNDLLRNRAAYDSMKENGQIEFMPTSFIRGLTWDNAIVIVDETQSCNLHEISSVITRCGLDTKLIILGDNLQNDLIYNKYDTSGMPQFLKIASRMQEFDIIKFCRQDIVRSDLTRSWVCAYEDEMGIS